MDIHLKTIRAFTLLAGCALAPAAGWSSSLTLMDYKTAGDQLLIRDSRTGLDWLKLTYTQGESPVTAEAVNPGFDLATPTQVQGLFVSAGGFTAFDGINRVVDQPTAQLLYNLFGSTGFANFGGGQYEAQTFGHVARPGTSLYDEYFVDLRNTFSAPGGAVFFYSLGNDNRGSSSIEANFLVRASVPEPASSILIGAGLLVISHLLRRSRGVVS